MLDLCTEMSDCWWDVTRCFVRFKGDNIKGKKNRAVWVAVIMDFIAIIAGGSLLKASLYKILGTLCSEQSDSSPWQKYNIFKFIKIQISFFVWYLFKLMALIWNLLVMVFITLLWTEKYPIMGAKAEAEAVCISIFLLFSLKYFNIPAKLFFLFCGSENVEYITHCTQYWLSNVRLISIYACVTVLDQFSFYNRNWVKAR